MSNLVDDLRKCADGILGIRDDIGAIKKIVYILTRTWTGSEPGAGDPSDISVQVLPTPHIVDFKHSLRLKTGGKIKEDDLLIKSISMQSYPLESDIDCSVPNKTTEKYYYIGSKLYNVVSVKKKYITWDIHIELTAKQKVYL